VKIEINNIKTIKNYALQNKVTTAYIYKLIGAKRINPTIIDGVKFIDILLYPSIEKLK
jgi:hypothetical protein